MKKFELKQLIREIISENAFLTKEDVGVAALVEDGINARMENDNLIIELKSGKRVEIYAGTSPYDSTEMPAADTFLMFRIT